MVARGLLRGNITIGADHLIKLLTVHGRKLTTYASRSCYKLVQFLERETGIEPATFSLGS